MAGLFGKKGSSKKKDNQGEPKKAPPTLLLNAATQVNADEVFRLVASLEKAAKSSPRKMDEKLAPLNQQLIPALQAILKQEKSDKQHRIAVRLFTYGCEYQPKSLLEHLEFFTTIIPEVLFAEIYKDEGLNPMSAVYRALHRLLQGKQLTSCLPAIQKSGALETMEHLASNGWAQELEKYPVLRKAYDDKIYPRGEEGWAKLMDALSEPYERGKKNKNKAHIDNTITLLLMFLPRELVSIIVCVRASEGSVAQEKQEPPSYIELSVDEDIAGPSP